MRSISSLEMMLPSWWQISAINLCPPGDASDVGIQLLGSCSNSSRCLKHTRQHFSDGLHSHELKPGSLFSLCTQHFERSNMLRCSWVFLFQSQGDAELSSSKACILFWWWENRWIIPPKQKKAGTSDWNSDYGQPIQGEQFWSRHCAWEMIICCSLCEENVFNYL